MSAEAAASDSEDEVLDWRVLGSLRTSQVDATVLKRGDKDHSPDGTTSQQETLRASRDAMYTALSAPRGHAAKSVLIGDWNAKLAKAQVTQTRGNYLNTMGSADRSGIHWLLPEEVIYLVERGSMLCYHNGHPLSVQGTVALCLPSVGDLEKMTVYSYLKKLGYIVRRPHANPVKSELVQSTSTTNFWSWYIALVNRPQLAWRRTYASYTSIYRDLQLVETPPVQDSPEEVCDFYAWKPATKFKKSAPGEPEYRIHVVKAGDKMPAYADLALMLGGISAKQSTKRSVLSRMREGRRAAVLAIVDSGIIGFVRMVEPVIEPIKPVID